MDNEPMTPRDWRDFNYYRSDRPCCVCGTTHQTGIDSRFGYVVCEHHHKMPPTEISRYNKLK